MRKQVPIVLLNTQLERIKTFSSIKEFKQDCGIKNNLGKITLIRLRKGLVVRCGGFIIYRRDVVNPIMPKFLVSDNSKRVAKIQDYLNRRKKRVYIFDAKMHLTRVHTGGLKELAEEYGCSVGNIKSLLNRTPKRLLEGGTNFYSGKILLYAKDYAIYIQSKTQLNVLKR